MPLPTTDILAWIESLGWNSAQEIGAPIVMGPYILKVPDKLVTVTPTPGPGFVYEAAADANAFQARVRGGQNDQPGAEALAYQLDSLILGAQFPAVSASGMTIVHIHRLGGTPSPLAPNPDDAERYEYTCQYLVIAGT
jgi:hypothetical protein